MNRGSTRMLSLQRWLYWKGAFWYSKVCTSGSKRASENKNASNSRRSLQSIARSYQHKALGELHRRYFLLPKYKCFSEHLQEVSLP